MKQTLLDFERCQGLVLSRTKLQRAAYGWKCHYRARYGKFCGHHTSAELKAKYLLKWMLKDKNRTLAEDLPGSY